MKRIMALAFPLCVVAGCGVSEMNEQSAINKGQEMVASTLGNPSSAMFSGVRMVESQAAGDLHSGFLCGTVRTRSSLGRYAEPKRFVANLQYTKRGTVIVSSVKVEQGIHAREVRGGVTFFEQFDWSKKCVSGAVTPAAVNVEGHMPVGKLMALKDG